MKLEELKASYDWRCAFDEAFGRGFTWDSWDDESQTVKLPLEMDDIQEIVCLSNGVKDEQDWIACFRMKDGRFLNLKAGCDYTGWDCQASGVHEYFATREEALGILAWTNDHAWRLKLPWATEPPKDPGFESEDEDSLGLGYGW